LDMQTFTVLGEGLASHTQLSELGLANTGSTLDSVLNGSPLLVLLELLARNRSVTDLDIANNCLDAGGPLVLEAAARHHPCLQCINLSKNPISLDGVRCVMRLLATTEHLQLKKVLLEDCSGLREPGRACYFDGDPSGAYSLNMARPANRAILRIMLLRFCEGSKKVSPSELIRGSMLRINGIDKPFTCEGLTSRSVLPVSGELHFHVCAEAYFTEVRGKSHGHDSSFGSATAYVEAAIRWRRLPLDIDRELAVLGQVIRTVNYEQVFLLLEAISYDLELTPEQVMAVCSKYTVPADIVRVCSCLLPCLVGAAHMRRMFAMTHSLGDLMRVGERGHHLLSLNLENPTGHYKLDLNSPSDLAVANRLLLLNRWEIKAWKAKGHGEISQFGDGKNFRNILFGGRDFHWHHGDWRLPGSDVFECDFVSLNRPCKAQEPLSEMAWQSLLAHIRSSRQAAATCSREASPRKRCPAAKLSDAMILQALCSVSAHLWLTCHQFRTLLCVVRGSRTRCDAMVHFALRLVDWPVNGKMCRAKFCHKSWSEVQARLGFIATFPFYQPENVSFVCDLSVYEQRLMLNMFCQLDALEKGDNLKNARIDRTGPRTVQKFEPFVMGVPQSWSQLDAIPSLGIFEATYKCSLDCVRENARGKLASELGGWPGLSAGEASGAVKWWAVLSDVPQEAVTLVEFLTARFKSLQQAFNACDTGGGDGKLNAREFINGMIRVGFELPELKRRKTAGRRQSAQPAISEPSSSLGESRDLSRNLGGDLSDHVSQRAAVLMSAYRFLDPNGDGAVTVKEFCYMEGIWRELQQSTWEFVRLVQEQFGSIEASWSEADENGSGAIDFDEFQRLAERWHFHGPLRQIFSFLTSGSANVVGKQEWLSLQHILPPDL